MLTIEALKEYGANVEEGLGRCLGNEAFYFRFITMAVGDANFERLRDAAAAGDFEAAFESAHALKGVLGNLSLTPLYDAVSAATELLRARTDMDYSEMVGEILALRDSLKELCK